MSAKPFGLRDVWTLSGTVSRRQYLTVGLTLMAFKFLCEAALGYTLTGELPSPLVYIAPSIKIRNALLGDYDNVATVLGLMLWSLPFAWIGVGMSVRRARDANLPGWVGVGFFLPVLNYLAMALLSVLPTRAAAKTPSQSPTRSPSHIAAAIQGVFAGGVVGSCWSP